MTEAYPLQWPDTKREQLKIEPAPIRIEVNHKSHTVLANRPNPTKEAEQ